MRGEETEVYLYVDYVDLTDGQKLLLRCRVGAGDQRYIDQLPVVEAVGHRTNHTMHHF